MKPEGWDAIVIGAGFGGLASALTLASSGARVLVLERLRYPGGCASTFVRGKTRYESGATLFSGFDEGQLFDRWIRDHALPVRFESFDPLVELRTARFRVGASPVRQTLVDRLASLRGVPEEGARSFFEEQERVATVLWELFDDEALLPPLSASAFLRHVTRTPRYLPLLKTVGVPLSKVLARHGLQDAGPLRTYLNAVCQITVQCGIDEVEAPFALAAMDYFFRGTGHIHGGIGELATALADAIERAGGEVRYSRGVTAVERTPRGWRVHARREVHEAPHVVANLTPHALQRVLGGQDAPRRLADRLEGLRESVEDGWGACMLYLQLPNDALDRPEPHHLQLIDDEDRPLMDGNHVFCSISGRDEQRNAHGDRTVTISTHVPMKKLRASESEATYVEEIQQRMVKTIESRAPELLEAAHHRMTASPRTFARFTGRDHGYVGGIPRRAGLASYRGMTNPPLAEGLHMVGDSVFPGQSTLATALGGVKVAERIRS